MAIAEFAYDPDPVEINAGESITWTNQDSVAHTATASNREVLQSGTLDQGASFTEQFDTAGIYEYFCCFTRIWMGPSSSRSDASPLCDRTR